MEKHKIDALFSSPEGKRIYTLFESAVAECSMRGFIEGGSLVGLSGGADSVMLTLLLLEYSRRESIGARILAVHINHGIRGDEADRDEQFARELASSLGIEFISRKIDVPALAADSGKSIEEAARDARYSAFSEIISGRNDVSSIALGHNATDNLETVIFNMMRGSGLRGISGIPPTRDNLFRPMLYIPKADIEAALISSGIEFVTDSTNKDTLYTRNYIRHEIIPRLSRLSDSPEQSVTRLTQNIRLDGEYIDSVAEDFLRTSGGEPSAKELLSLHPAVFSRVVSAMAKAVSGRSPERVHVAKIRELLALGSFSYSLPGACTFVSSCGKCAVVGETAELPTIALEWGTTELPSYSATVELFDGKAKTSHNVYKFSIQADLSSAIIKGGLYIRARSEGDVYFYGGMTHKLKKMLIDRKIPKDKRGRVPVLCDDAGIVWVAGFGVRDDGVRGECRSVRISYDKCESGFYIPPTNKKKGTVNT